MTSVVAGTVIGFVGLGRMGSPMVRRLLMAGGVVRGFDVSEDAVAGLRDEEGFVVADGLLDVATESDVVVLMLPSSDIVERVLLADGLLAGMAAQAVIVDMSSSEPVRTQELAHRARERGLTFVDAPVSGGVRGARDGTLTIMAGGPIAAVEQIRPVLAAMGSRILHVGDVGAGHAVKALNNLMSATHLLVTSEALLAAQRFGLDPAVVLDAVNTSSGRSGSTENKWPNFVLTGSFNSGFGLQLMLKDMRIALDLEENVGTPRSLSQAAVTLWSQAAETMAAAADHTEIVRWLEHARS